MRENANGFKKISLENEPSRNLNMNDGKAGGVRKKSIRTITRCKLCDSSIKMH